MTEEFVRDHAALMPDLLKAVCDPCKRQELADLSRSPDRAALIMHAISRTGPAPEPQPSMLRTFITNLQNRAFGKKPDVEAAVEQEPEPAYDDDTPRLG